MSNEQNFLPPYPCIEDMWDKLKNELRPIVVYGMGNGAEKLIKRFKKYGIEISDFFASDGFVRGHSFYGKRVKNFSEIRECYDDFVIVLSFATNREEVLFILSELDMRYDMYIPDMPVAGEEYFDREFFNNNYEKILEAYNRFADSESKSVYASIINYKLTGKMKYLMQAFCGKKEMYSLLNQKNIEFMIDAGAYDGDTVKEAKEYIKGLKFVYAIEPDIKNFKKLSVYCEAENEISVIPFNAGVWNVDKQQNFITSGNRNSSVSSTASHQHKSTIIDLIKIDSLTIEKADYIKYDVEGAEREALEGSRETIKTYKPSLLISVYHRSKDVFDIVNFMAREYPEYSFYLRRLKCVPAWEINLIAIAR